MRRLHASRGRRKLVKRRQGRETRGSVQEKRASRWLLPTHTIALSAAQKWSLKQLHLPKSLRLRGLHSPHRWESREGLMMCCTKHMPSALPTLCDIHFYLFCTSIEYVPSSNSIISHFIHRLTSSHPKSVHIFDFRSSQQFMHYWFYSRARVSFDSIPSLQHHYTASFCCACQFYIQDLSVHSFLVHTRPLAPYEQRSKKHQRNVWGRSSWPDTKGAQFGQVGNVKYILSRKRAMLCWQNAYEWRFSSLSSILLTFGIRRRWHSRPVPRNLSLRNKQQNKRFRHFSQQGVWL